MRYFTSKDTNFIINELNNPTWVSLCHKQPIMDNSFIFLDIDDEEAFGVCRRCGKQSKLTTGIRIFCLGYE